MQNTSSEVRKATLIGASCFLGYAGCYLGRNILSSMLPQMIECNVYSREHLGQMGSSFLITYGLGQLINGIIGDKISAKYMISSGLFLSGILCLIFPLFHGLTFSMILWALCGFLCSMLWGPISKMVGENTPQNLGRIVLTFMTISSIVGAGLAYLIALLSATVSSWRMGYLITGTLLIVISLICFIMNICMEKKGIIKPFTPQASVEFKVNFIPYLYRNAFFYMCLVSILNGIIRNAVVFWIPTFITEQFSLPIQTAASILLLLPITNLFGTIGSIALAKRLQNNEKKTLIVLFSLALIMFICMFLLNGNGMIINTLMLLVASASMTGGCNMIFSFYVLRFTETGRVSTVAGILDFVSYFFASFANSAFAFMVGKTGWNYIVLSWAAVSLLGVVFARMAMRKESKTCLDEIPDM